jgi:hypothetical protein
MTKPNVQIMSYRSARCSDVTWSTHGPSSDFGIIGQLYDPKEQAAFRW